MNNIRSDCLPFFSHHSLFYQIHFENFNNTLFLIKLISADQISHLSDLKWKKRIIIIAEDENFYFNKRVKKYQKELEEREISIIFLIIT